MAAVMLVATISSGWASVMPAMAMVTPTAVKQSR
jgi:hypothetical protein